MNHTRPNLTCPLCSAASYLRIDITGYLKHIRIFQAHDPSFKITCGIAGCQRTYNNFCTFANHVSAIHNTDATIATTAVPSVTVTTTVALKVMSRTCNSVVDVMVAKAVLLMDPIC